ncbi:glycoside hydrolase superfamily [Russula aff. rugulosa BPL654]|nr:glycoside hydrolase superfamily [Russula aff. rugulosa BPL654]
MHPSALLLWLFTLLSPVFTQSSSSPFVTVSGTGFSLNDKNFTFVGTNAYWLPYLNSDDDIRNTLANMSKSGINVVRTWAFNDVTTVPDAGSWLLLIKDGNTTTNPGPNGIQRLDKIIAIAKQYNIYVYFSLTNNWFPFVNEPVSSLPRNFLCNYYGGMDAYVQEFGVKKTHDEFYTNMQIRKEFNKYLRFIVSHYVNEPGIIAWELANDARCSSTLPSSDHCNTNTVTLWHAETAKFIRSIDPNHLIASGVHGFLCPSCPKLFSHQPPPQNSPALPGRSTRKFHSKLRKLCVESRASGARDSMTIRGLWTAPSEAKRRSNGGDGSAYNGAFGVDSQDILNAPDINFGTFQMFPDQFNYGTTGTVTDVQAPSSNFNNTLNDTVTWIHAQIDCVHTTGKPVVLSAFGLVTQDNLPYFVPVKDTSPVCQGSSFGTFGTGVSQDQINTAYSTWSGLYLFRNKAH